jgi:hypothetical protein
MAGVKRRYRLTINMEMETPTTLAKKNRPFLRPKFAAVGK